MENKMGQMKILVVDDNVNNLSVIGNVLRGLKLNVALARSGADAIKLAKKIKPDLFLLDVMMPEMDGFELCTILKKESIFKDVPVIFVTAKTETEDIVKGFTVGGVDYITKPIVKQEVVARVLTHLKISNLTVELRRNVKELQMQQEQLEKDLIIAGQIQRQMLPQNNLNLNGIKVSWFFEPCQTVGGDILNLIPLANNELAFYILDVSGHGVPSSLVAVSVAQVLTPLFSSVYVGNGAMLSNPSSVLEFLNKQFPFHKYGKFFTIFYGVINSETKMLTYSSGGHPPAYRIGTDGKLQALRDGGPVIGVANGVEYKSQSISLNSKDKVFIYTDGVIEFENEKDEMYGEGLLQQNLTNYATDTSASLINSIIDSLKEFGGEKMANDDVSILCFEAQW